MVKRIKPNALKLLEGNPGKRVLQESGIEALGEPFIAEHLMDDARGCIMVVKESMPDSIYSALDSFLLAAFGMAWAVHKRASLEISSPSFQFVINGSSNSEVVSPWIRILNQQAAIIASLGDRLGLDPKSRASLSLPGARQQKSKFEGLLGSSARKTSSISSSN